MNKFQVIATVNSHLLKPSILEEFIVNGTTIFRINGSHILPKELGPYAESIRNAVGNRAKILVDLPGNKIRSSGLMQPLVIKSGEIFELRADQLNYPQFLTHLKAGDMLLANDSLYKFRVESVLNEKATLYSYSDGLLTNNKGIHLTGKHPALPFLFERDHELIRQSIQHKLDYIGLSFVRTAADVEEALKLIKDTNIKPIVKIETTAAVENLDQILGKADEFLVDRGDLSCDVGIENVDHYQKLILRRGKNVGKKVYFATQFFHSMVNNNVPLIAEACGLSDVLACGVDGIQLSEETAIGKHPVEVLKTVQRMLFAQRKTLQIKKENHNPVLWLTGPSGSGKTTVARAFIEKIEQEGFTTCLIDGDDFRAFWGNDLGYTKEDRLKNLRNITFTAFQASQSFDVVVVSSLSPYRSLRDFAREKIVNYHEVYVRASLETCRQRDPKGHYKKALMGEHQNFVGVTEEYEPPTTPELVLNTESTTVDQSVKTLMDYCLKK